MSKTGRFQTDRVNRDHRASIALTLALCVLVGGGNAWAQGSASGVSEESAQQERLKLFVTVVRNGVSLPDVLLEIEQRKSPQGEEEVWVEPSDLAAAGVRLDEVEADQEWLEMGSMEGVEYTLDPGSQSMSLTLSLDRLGTEAQDFTRARNQYPLSPGVGGVAFDYDLAGQSFGGDWNASAWVQARTLGGPSQLTQSFRHNTGDTLDGRYSDTIRLDTQWSWRNPERMVSVEVGDGVSRGLEWARSVRFGGIQIGRDFSLQPYVNTNPQLLLSSSAALPSTVEVFLDGVRTEEREVLPGRFDIGLPIPSGGTGSARMIVTDISGITREIDVPLYGSSRLLARGLTDGSFSLGYLRQDYGLQSNRYDDRPFGSVSGRRGITDRWTLEGHAQWRDGVGVVGVGAVALLPRQWGEVSGSASKRTGNLPEELAEHSQGAWQYQAGWSREGKRVFVGAHLTRRDTGFFDVVGVLEGQPMPTASDQVWAGTSTRQGQWSASYTRQTQPRRGDFPGRTQRVAQIAWSTQWRGATLSARAQRDLTQSRTSGFLSVSIPLGERQRVQLHQQLGSWRNRTNASWSSPVPGSEPGWGWRAGVGITDGNQIESSWAQVDRRAASWEGSAGWARQAGETLNQAQLRGGGAWISGVGPTLSRQTGSAFAVVETNMKDVPVRLENRLVGRTGEDGRLLIEQLMGWQANRISIDTQDLPLNMRLEGSDQRFAVPRQSQGALVKFNLIEVAALETRIHQDGGPAEVGSPWVILNGQGDETLSGMIGNEGLLWADLTGKEAAVILVSGAEGVCRVHLPNPLPNADETGTIRLDTLTCTRTELP